jgi:hypothetical protein
LLKAGPLDVRVIAAAERNSGTDFDIKLPEESRSYVLVSLSITNPSNISERLDSDGFRLVVDGIRVPVDNSATAMVSDNFGQQKMGNILGSWVDPGETRSFLLVFQPSKYARRHAIEISRSDRELYSIDLAPYLSDALTVDEMIPTPTPSPIPTVTPIPTFTPMPTATRKATSTLQPTPTMLPTRLPVSTSRSESGNTRAAFTYRMQIVGRDFTKDPHYVIVSVRFKNETDYDLAPPIFHTVLKIGSQEFPYAGYVDEFGDFKTSMGFLETLNELGPGEAAVIDLLFKVPLGYSLDDATLATR